MEVGRDRTFPSVRQCFQEERKDCELSSPWPPAESGWELPMEQLLCLCHSRPEVQVWV